MTIKLRYFLFLLLIFQMTINAGTTGKLSGYVKDQESGEPLIGVNVIVDGTNFGAATDINGFYLINNLPPETYSITFSAIGYQKKRITNVKIAVDFTTKIDAELPTESVELETIVVQAETPMVRKDLTSSQVSIDATQIASLPVESIAQILTLQAGITQGVGGELHIRGGRSTEIAYTVNGVSINNPFDNSRSVNIATNAIQELSVVSGTFNAEYGNALSGIVNTVTKEGGGNYNGKVSFYTGEHFSSRSGTFLNVDDLDPINNIVSELTFGGPVPFLQNNLSFFLSGRYEKDKGYLYGVREHTIYDSVFKSSLDPNDIRISRTGDGQLVSMNPSTDISATGKLTIKPASTIKINYDVLYSNSEYKVYSHDFKYNPDAAYNNYDWGLLNSLEVRHALNNQTFYTLQGSYNINDYKQYLFPLLDASGGEVDFHPGMDWTTLRPDNRYQPDHKLNRASTYTFNSGGTLNNHYYQRSYTLAGKFDIVSQINKNHEIKLGLQAKNHTLDFQNFEVKRDTNTYLVPTIPPVEGVNHDKYRKTPFEFSAYIQDKMEFDKLIVNMGLRYDMFNAQSQYSTDSFNPSPYNPELPSTVDPNSLLEDAAAKHQISPRIGLSFPITDAGIIHFSYGHFFQMPPFSYLYTNPNFEYSFAVGTPVFGNANLNPEKTVTYEIGLQQQLLEDLAFNVTGFYKDVRDLLAYQQIRIDEDETYFTYVNKDYGNIKGITFSLTKRRTPSSMFSVTLDYTFQVAEGNETNSDAFFLDLQAGQQTEKVPVLLAWDQTHTLNTTVSVGQPNDWNVSLVGRLGTGLPYTPQIDDNQLFLRTNSGRRPSQARVDLLAEKSFSIFGSGLTFFLKVFNLFDTLNERLIYNDTGRATYTLSANQGPALATDKLSQEIEGIRPVADYFSRPNYYLPPREVKLGVSFEF